MVSDAYASRTKPPIKSLQNEAEETSSLFPALLVEAEKVAASVMSGVHGRRQAGTGETFWQHRPYAFGDSVSMIDWRQSARMNDRLYVRENEWEAAAAIWLWRDPTASMIYHSAPTHPEKRHRANVLAIALSMLLARGGERIGVLGGSRTGETTRLFHGRHAATKVLEHLDHSRVDQATTIPYSDRIKSGHRVVLISDFLSSPEVIGQAIHHFSTLGASGIICQVLDPAEENFPFRGRKEFLDTESDDRLLFGNTQTLKEDYTTTFNRHQHELRAIANQYGWPMVTHLTDQPPTDPLLFFITHLMAMRGDVAAFSAST